jgi:hypothetical protein
MKSAEYTIEHMRPSEHSEDSWDSLFGCADEDRRNYKLMYKGRAIETELTFKKAHEWKMHYEAEDAYAREEDERMREHPESFIRL